MRGLVGGDFQVALNKLRLLHEACLDANAAVTEHWRQDHTNFGQVSSFIRGKLSTGEPH